MQIRKGNHRASVRALHKLHIARGGTLRFPAFRRALRVAGVTVKDGMAFGVEEVEDTTHAMFKPSNKGG